MKYLIVGLGNIGPEYAKTRHNVGFMVADYLAKKHNTSFEMDRLAYVADFKHKGRSITVIKPTTYMNLSGKAVKYWANQLKIKTENILVIVDDLAIPYTSLRMRGKGGAAGHNGLKDIEAQMQTAAYPRLRFGIGDNYSKGKQVDFVLGEFTEDEKIDLDGLIEKSADMCLSFASIGLSRTMTQYNK
ncbi:aminoacyl-tRNA hydrolase [Flammeovirga aprica]|uniref:Peptidyl-tRNA hydrolase n=1 Tax=Flammeovirga aprica JL-4 TaxID=694437 RepID=A0A7X9XCL5_9BACT|nr:aminoacyl-tRNA hydrolase [Flammeovirga aprica]NME71937.1 aminoacyl-tRNA hydrolase [Flammeovirga aprica JL-4]